MTKNFLLFFTLICSTIFSMEHLKRLNGGDLSTSIGEFGFTLLESMQNNDQNIVFSPFSIASSLLTLSDGSEGSTKSQIQNTLRISSADKTLPSWYNRLYTDLFISEDSCKFLLTNILFIGLHAQVLESFEQSVKSSFHAEIIRGTFNRNKNQQIDRINHIIAARNDFNIIDMLSSSTMSDDAKLLSINTLLIKGVWQKPFNNSESEPGSFFNFFEDETTTYKMRQTSELLYYEDSDFQVISLPIDCKNKKSDINFLVFLPKSRAFLNWGKFKLAISKLSYTQLDVKMPRFSLNQNHFLKGALENIGLKQAFTRLADFSKINNRLDLYLNDVIHGCAIRIDENGINVKDNDLQVVEYKIHQDFKAIPFDIDRPFYFVVCDLKSKTPLSIGIIQRI